MTTQLQTLILNRMSELGLTYRTAAARSGGKVSHGTLNYIVLGKHSGKVDEDTAQGIALALDLPRSKVREAAGMKEQPPTEFRLPDRAARLSHEERIAVVKVVDILLDLRENGDSPSSPQPQDDQPDDAQARRDQPNGEDDPAG